ncbi:MAG: hypothetical protein JW881_12390 [Spirochaetales bacterium]|nr:hypothetical protein [Spirochaetales bacterium]
MKRNMYRAVIFSILLLILGGCAMEGDVYLSFFWYDGQKPDATFTCSAPNIPAALVDLEKGVYYKTKAGSYTVSCSWTAPPGVYSTNFTLEADSTILGVENAYYDISFYQYANPVCLKVPQDF